MKHEIIISAVAIIMLLLAIPDIWPYGYFQILRVVVTGSAAYLAYLSYIDGKIGGAWLMGIIAVIFNPIFPVHLVKEAWIVVDLAAAGIFISYFLKMKNEKIK